MAAVYSIEGPLSPDTRGCVPYHRPKRRGRLRTDFWLTVCARLQVRGRGSIALTARSQVLQTRLRAQHTRWRRLLGATHKDYTCSPTVCKYPMDLIIIVGIILLVGPWGIVLVAVYRASVAEADSERRSSADARLPASDAQANRPPDDTAPELKRCPACGTANDPGYTFCRVCVQQLAGG